ncbi:MULTISPECIES: DOMON-like domain-containing protein [unclassified Sphingomonas]|uniref:DOMON-like domain-containing protein n=1 Tax=unclassified Sphingomonas TaxID=196159 RepID=UPI0008369F47|nr:MULTISPECIES: DOMON-like domain-containing protein [unclassified Sphingomonas]
MHHALRCHPDTPARRVDQVHVSLALDAGIVSLVWRIAPATSVAMPAPAPAVRTDGLWQRTCVELFAAPAGAAGYVEFNLAPSGAWAAYRFDGYRAGMAPLDLRADPAIATTIADDALLLTARLALDALPPGPVNLGLSAVIEEVDGTKSYWALAHAGEKPDFHHPDGFVLELPAKA